MAMFLKLIKFLWPFLKEMVLGEKTMTEAVKTNKFRTLLLALIVCSFATNFWLLPKVINITNKYVKLDQQYQMVVAGGSAPPKKKTSDSLSTSSVESNSNSASVATNTSTPADNQPSEYDDARAAYDRIRQREAKR